MHKKLGRLDRRMHILPRLIQKERFLGLLLLVTSDDADGFVQKQFGGVRTNRLPGNATAVGTTEASRLTVQVVDPFDSVLEIVLTARIVAVEGFKTSKRGRVFGPEMPQVPLPNGVATIALASQQGRHQGLTEWKPFGFFDRQLGREPRVQRQAARQEGGATGAAGRQDVVVFQGYTLLVIFVEGRCLHLLRPETDVVKAPIIDDMKDDVRLAPSEAKRAQQA